MELDVKKVSPTPKDQWEAIEFMVDAHQSLIDALFIMEGFVNSDDEESKEHFKKKAAKFIEKFALPSPPNELKEQ